MNRAPTLGSPCGERAQEKSRPGGRPLLILARESPRAQNARRMLTAPDKSGDSPRPAAWTVKERVVLASMR